MHNLLQQPRAGLSKNRGLAPRYVMQFYYIACDMESRAKGGSAYNLYLSMKGI